MFFIELDKGQIEATDIDEPDKALDRDKEYIAKCETRIKFLEGLCDYLLEMTDTLSKQILEVNRELANKTAELHNMKLLLNKEK